MSDFQFQLKTAPPRAGRNAPTRKRLEHRWAEINERTAIVVTAPQGFGKTTLLAQWRRNWLERGAYVAWASLDALDERARFVDLLVYALRAATGRESFTRAAAHSLNGTRDLDSLTGLLAEVAALATPTVIILDDVHRMPQDTMREMLAYLLNNAPPNLQFLVGSRRPLELPLTDLIAAGSMASLDAHDLRLALDESLDVLRARFGARIALDDAVRLHDLTEGWPLGLQLAASTIEGTVDLHEVIGQLSGRRGDIHRFFFETLLSRLPQEMAAFMIRISILEVLNADLCEAVTGSAAAGQYLEKVAYESPVVTEGEGRDWLRLHAMARDFLLGQFDKLPADERRKYYERAAVWYAEHGYSEDAARHALSSGNDALAIAHASRCLRDIARAGRLAEAREWIRRLPPQAMAQDVRLQLTCAWITALGDGAATVPALMEQIAMHPQFDETCRFEAALITASASMIRDQPGPLADALLGCDNAPPGASPLHVESLITGHANLAYMQGDPERARQLLAASLSASPRDPQMRLTFGYKDVTHGLCYLAEGNTAKVIAVLQPQLELAEREVGRRSAVPAMLAAIVAGALFLRDEPEQALETLADRVDVIERVALPEAIVVAYRVLAACALSRGEDAHALEILVALRDLGLSRDLPRLSLFSLADQVRIHAIRGRSQTASELLGQIQALTPVFDELTYQAFVPQFRRTLGLARAHVCIARSDFDHAETALNIAVDTPVGARRGAAALVARALLAFVAHERGRPEARNMLAEVLSLADLAGMRRYVETAHPGIAAMLAPASSQDEIAQPGVAQRARFAAAQKVSVHVPAGVDPAGVPSTGGLLTPKEARILSLLAVGRANKEIARAMDIGEQTVKWHLKNVFFKLNAASRKHAVDRARLLGLLSA